MSIVLTVDAVCFAKDGGLLLVRRKRAPFKNCWALPGGKVNLDETLEDACLRELFEETGLTGEIVGLIGVYSRPDRDPRGRWVSVAFLVTVNDDILRAASDASDVQWKKSLDDEGLAFDHELIVRDANLHRRH